MVELWFGIAAVMLTAYVVLDGFDFGAGALHLFVARTDAERRQVLAAIGPFWDGNEVWLLATGGVLFLAFPPRARLGAVGVLLRDLLVLWMLILRGISIEFRSHVEHPLWRSCVGLVFCRGQRSAAGALRCRARQPAARPAARRATAGSRSRCSPTSRARPTGRHSRLVHGARRASSRSWPRRARRDVPGVEDRRPGAGAEPASRDAGCTPRSRCSGPLLTVATTYVNAPMLAALPRRPLAWLSVLLALGRGLILGRRSAFVGRRDAAGVPRLVRVPDRHAGRDRGLRVPGDAAGR